jgi:hypothetical protein
MYQLTLHGVQDLYTPAQYDIHQLVLRMEATVFSVGMTWISVCNEI